MSFKLTSHQEGDAVIVDTRGDLTLGEGTSALRDKMRKLVKAGSKRILLNMAGVTSMDSPGLGALVAAQTTVTTAGGEMKLLNLAGRVHDLLRITGLCTVFETLEAPRNSSVVPLTPLAIRKGGHQTGGLEPALYDQQRPGVATVLEGSQKQRTVPMVCGDSPEGRARWTVRLLPEEAVERRNWHLFAAMPRRRKNPLISTRYAGKDRPGIAA